MKRSWLSWFAILAMMMMVFAAAGCSDDDDDNNGGGTPAFDVTAAVTAAGDDYFDDYMIEFQGTPMGVNVAADGGSGAFAKIVADPDYYYVIDMRSPADYAYAHIEGAVNYETPADVVAAIDMLPTDRIILVTCYTGQEASYTTSLINLLGTETGHVAQNLKFGASGILPLNMVRADGTFNYATANDRLQDMVTTASPPKHAAGDYPAIEADVDNATEALKARAAAAAAAWGATAGMSHTAAADATMDDLYLINYFSAANYADGHLPTAINYAPGDLVTSKFLNTLPVDMPIGVYCYTGQTSAQVAAYLQMMGYDGKTVFYGIQKLAFDDEAINDSPWHGPLDDYTSIFTGTAFE
jgi:rhodanese-related sulfurtransferase